ncbi:ABC transporter permease [Alteromonas macleodii]|uniref:ABC transporter permease n=1 Tax=Alteromonas macleodii TaxID=28108 RepID=UPI0012709A3B|nr:ABC transporter permease subunit [Alteromonas macleodii]CAI2389855.1 putative thiamine transport system permease protein [Alteromonas macleodii]CAI3951863.1 putative thiamine transport system permease protein [Alteromonas macleodii]CAI3952788.1 putative thiamine transport system permease protein [Alteromonas macleodii]CAI3952867.1 putative thiamine transport system permease protein [Alteromonas macleodii]VTO39451.1 putative thiamine transport system permease protein [Alteromonas macleodii]
MFTHITLVARWCLLLLLCIPVLAGLVGVIFPALGYFPAIGANAFSTQVFATLFGLPDIWQMMWLSLFTGIGSTLLAVIAAFCILATFYQSSLLGKIQGVLSPFLVFPHAAAAISLLFVVSPSGIFAAVTTRLNAYFSHAFTTPFVNEISEMALPAANDGTLLYDSLGLSILIALSLKELPFILLMTLSVMSQPLVKKKLTGYVKVGTALGYSPTASFFKLVLPTIFSQIKLPLLAVLVFATSNVEIPLILGPNNPSTLAVAIMHWFNHIDLSMRLLASSAAVVQVAVSAVAVLLFFGIERLVTYTGKRSLSGGNRYFADAVLRTCGFVIMAFYIILICTGVYTVVVYSFAKQWHFPLLLPEGLTLLHWNTATSALTTPLINTLLLGVLVSTTSLVLVLFTLESEQLKPARAVAENAFSVSLFLPLLVPGVAFLYGLVWFQQLVFQNAVWFHTYVAHMVYVLPYVFLSMAVAYRKFDNRYAMVAKSLGKTPWQVFYHVKLPSLFSAIMVAWALGLAISFSQYLPTLLASGGTLPTVTTEAVASVSGSSTRLTAVYVIIQAVMPLIGFMIAWYMPAVATRRRSRQMLVSDTHSNRSADPVQ